MEMEMCILCILCRDAATPERRGKLCNDGRGLVAVGVGVTEGCKHNRPSIIGLCNFCMGATDSLTRSLVRSSVLCGAVRCCAHSTLGCV
eukprot:jgi/Psemu1/300589/fgenesh1_kg.14_\